jgi:hypothetical protein
MTKLNILLNENKFSVSENDLYPYPTFRCKGKQ